MLNWTLITRLCLNVIKTCNIYCHKIPMVMQWQWNIIGGFWLLRNCVDTCIFSNISYVWNSNLYLFIWDFLYLALISFQTQKEREVMNIFNNYFKGYLNKKFKKSCATETFNTGINTQGLLFIRYLFDVTRNSIIFITTLNFNQSSKAIIVV